MERKDLDLTCKIPKMILESWKGHTKDGVEELSKEEEEVEEGGGGSDWETVMKTVLGSCVTVA